MHQNAPPGVWYFKIFPGEDPRTPRFNERERDRVGKGGGGKGDVGRKGVQEGRKEGGLGGGQERRARKRGIEGGKEGKGLIV